MICAASTGNALLSYVPDLCRVILDNATLLGSPIGSSVSIDTAVRTKTDALRIMKSRLCYLSKHDALVLLRHSFAIPKVLYILHTAPCFTSLYLEAYNSVLQSTPSEVLNIHFHDFSARIQATLPVSAIGIGIRRAFQLAPSAFLASAAGTHSIIYDTVYYQKEWPLFLILQLRKPS